jgi:hypothetical protein
VGILLLLSGCGGGGGGGSSAIIQANVLPLTVDPGPGNGVNHLFASVTICAPGSNINCQTVDHVLVDTGSTGLRIMASALSLSLATELDVNNNAVGSCGQFASGYTWGPVKIADVKMSGERANAVPIQLISDASFPFTVPVSCANSVPLDTVQKLGANGLLGIGVFREDCGTPCSTTASHPGFYYACPAAGACQTAQVALAQQIQNPVSLLPVDNNGVMIALPSVPAVGAGTLNGSLVFGIGTQFNNALGSAQVFAVDATFGSFTTTLNGVTFADSIIDSGSNGIFFDSTILDCAANALGFYCPTATQLLSARIDGVNATTATVNFQVANASTLFQANPSFSVFTNVAGSTNLGSFYWGLPFFFGRHVFFAVEGSSTPAGSGPYVAF